MSVEAMAQTAPEQPQLHSPPDSNDAMKLDGSDDDSELSDLDESQIQRPPTAPTSTTDEEEIKKEEQDAPAQEEEEEEDDIGEVTPAEWSGTVPVFRPTMHQFKDFKKFVCRAFPMQVPRLTYAA